MVNAVNAVDVVEAPIAANVRTVASALIGQPMQAVRARRKVGAATVGAMIGRRNQWTSAPAWMLTRAAHVLKTAHVEARVPTRTPLARNRQIFSRYWTPADSPW